MKRIVLIAVSILVTHFCFGQQIPEMGVTIVHINNSDKNIVAEVKPLKSDPTPEPSSYYYWYGAGIIHQTQGGYSGKLLNGKYNEYYPDKSLKEQGNFNKGQKNGPWKTWDEHGNLKQLITYHNGEKTGLFNLYGEQGSLTQTGSYKENRLDGKIIFYSKDSTRVVRYKNGKVVSPQAHNFWDKFKFVNKIFKKKPHKTITKPKQK